MAKGIKGPCSQIDHVPLKLDGAPLVTYAGWFPDFEQARDVRFSFYRFQATDVRTRETISLHFFVPIRNLVDRSIWQRRQPFLNTASAVLSSRS